MQAQMGNPAIAVPDALPALGALSESVQKAGESDERLATVAGSIPI